MLALVVALKVATVPFPLAVWSAERIVVGKVISIHSIARVRVATLEVETTLKGASVTKADFVACKTWTCDSSYAEVGERGLYLLGPLKRTGRFEPFPDLSELAKMDNRPSVLSLDGRGRYVIQEAGVPVDRWQFGLSMTPSMRKALGVPKRKIVREADLLKYVNLVLRTPPRSVDSFHASRKL